MGIIKEIQQINDDRTLENVSRRILKLGEEFGELSEAYLSASSPKNMKNKSFEDFREEAVDCVIMALDIALTPISDNEKDNDIKNDIKKILDKKLSKWKNQIKNKEIITDV